VPGAVPTPAGAGRAGSGDTDTGSEGKGEGNRFSGSIEEIPLFDLLQLLCTSKKSGVLEVQSNAGQGQGHIYLRNGQIVYATLRRSPELPPRKAAYRLLAWQSGTFELKPPDGRSFDRELDEPTEGLVLEAMHQFDEIARFGRKLPPGDLRLVLARPTPPVKQLNRQQIDVLKVIHAYPRSAISRILDLSPLPDLETYHALIFLGKNGYLLRSDGSAQPGNAASARQS